MQVSDKTRPSVPFANHELLSSAAPRTDSRRMSHKQLRNKAPGFPSRVVLLDLGSFCDRRGLDLRRAFGGHLQAFANLRLAEGVIRVFCAFIDSLDQFISGRDAAAFEP